MTQSPLLLTGPLARAARALVEMSAANVAAAAGISRRELREFEKGLTALTTDQRTALEAALESFGAFFIADGQDARGYGVRLKFSNAKARRLETWEGEGGQAAEDDV